MARVVPLPHPFLQWLVHITCVDKALTFVRDGVRGRFRVKRISESYRTDDMSFGNNETKFLHYDFLIFDPFESTSDSSRFTDSFTVVIPLGLPYPIPEGFQIKPNPELAIGMSFRRL